MHHYISYSSSAKIYTLMNYLMYKEVIFSATHSK